MIFSTMLTEKIIKKSLLTIYDKEIIPCYGYRYLSILTDGAFNPDPFDPTGFLLHSILLKNSNRKIIIYGEMRNIPIKGNSQIIYDNLANSGENSTVQSGYGNIYFYLSNYINDFMSIKGNIGFQWEDSFTVIEKLEQTYHFGIDKVMGDDILVVPFIADCYNKLVYLYKESNVADVKKISFYFEDNDIQDVNLVADTLTELLLPCKRFLLHFKANAIEPTDFDIMIKFLKG